jgi:hypothetical protein
MKRSALIVALTLVFVSGLAVGAIGYRLLVAKPAAAVERRLTPEEHRQRYVEMMRTRLKLSEEQLAELNAILDETRRRFDEYEQKSSLEKQAIRQQHVERINAMLTEQQRLEYAKIRKEREERRKQMEKQGRPPRSPGR